MQQRSDASPDVDHTLGAAVVIAVRDVAGVVNRCLFGFRGRVAVARRRRVLRSRSHRTASGRIVRRRRRRRRRIRRIRRR